MRRGDKNKGRISENKREGETVNGRRKQEKLWTCMDCIKFIYAKGRSKIGRKKMISVTNAIIKNRVLHTKAFMTPGAGMIECKLQ